MVDSTRLFTDRVSDYVRYRPGYPTNILTSLVQRCDLLPGWAVADLGCGPGNLSRLFLDNGNRVLGVEPNEAMLAAARATFSGEGKFEPVAATAEATTLPSESVQLVVAGQAFHWFDPEASGTEARRILKAPGWAALVWNSRLNDASAFMAGYEETLLALLPKYRSDRAADHGASSMNAFFRETTPETLRFPHEVSHTWDSLRGLSLSTSYAPKEGEDGHEMLITALKRLFEENQVGGTVSIAYEAEVHFGRIK